MGACESRGSRVTENLPTCMYSLKVLLLDELLKREVYCVEQHVVSFAFLVYRAHSMFPVPWTDYGLSISIFDLTTINGLYCVNIREIFCFLFCKKILIKSNRNLILSINLGNYTIHR